jgi:hypothetical protein
MAVRLSLFACSLHVTPPVGGLVLQGSTIVALRTF